MEAIKIIKHVSSNVLRIKDVDKFIGKDVEVIILPVEKQKASNTIDKKKVVEGILKKYANPSLISKEKKAWQNAMKEKHAVS